MKIIVVGCGKIGRAIVASLSGEGHSIVVVDSDQAAITDVNSIYDVNFVTGSGTDYMSLMEAGADKAELLVATTGSDETNMLCCCFAHRMGAKHTIARIRNPQYNEQSLAFVNQQLGLTYSINPERQVAKELFRMLKLPSALNVETFSGGRFEMVEMRLRDQSPLDNVKLSDMRRKYSANVLVCAVQRGEEVYIPDGSFTLKSGDRVGITAGVDQIQKFLKQLDMQTRQARNVMILGASRTAYYLTGMLLSAGSSVKVIEKDRDRCVEFGNAFKNAVVICGDGAQQELLLEEGLRSMDAFVALTGMDEENILISYYASTQKVSKVIAKVNRPELVPIAQHLGLDSLISPKRITSDILVRYARALNNSLGSNVETLYKLMDDKVEALEFRAQPGLKLLGKPLKQLSFKPNILLAGILRGRKIIIPSGDDCVMSDDRVVVLAAGQQLGDLSDILL